MLVLATYRRQTSAVAWLLRHLRSVRIFIASIVPNAGSIIGIENGSL